MAILVYQCGMYIVSDLILPAFEPNKVVTVTQHWSVGGDF
ncbi:Uncharacterised protein [Vibrio cholerae]|nr:Uncharacterised protein [Vibrio cholerae]